MEELALRIRALARRGAPVARVVATEFGGLRHDPDSDVLSWHGEPIRLGRLQRRILVHLLPAAPARVTRAALIDAVWEDDPPSSDALRSHVYALAGEADGHR